MRTTALTAATATGVAGGWNLTSVGAVAEPMADAYGATLATVGLLGAALWLSHALVQAPAGRAIDSVGARTATRYALVAMIVVNALAALTPSIAAALPLRFATGFCVGTGMVAAAVRATPRGSVGQGWIGGGASAGAALAIAVGPALEQSIGWTAPYLGAIVLALLMLPLAGSGPETPLRHAASRVDSGRLFRPALLPPALALGTCIVASFALGNWITVVLRNTGEFGAVGAGTAGALVVAGGALTRPLGGKLAESNGRGASLLVSGSLLVIVLACAAIVAVPERPVLLASMTVLGLAAGLPFGAVVQLAPRIVPDRPGAAIGLVGTLGTGCGVIAIPLLGLSTGSDSSARICFGALGLLALVAVAVCRPRPETRPVLVTATDGFADRRRRRRSAR